MLALVALCLTGHIDPTHFAGTLTGEPPDLSEVPVSQLTEEQLRSEQKRLEPYKTGFIAPVVLTAVGGGLIIVGAVFMVVGIVYAYLPSILGGMGLNGFAIAGYIIMGVSGAMLIAGGVLLAIGLVKLFPALARRRDAAERREEIQRRLDALDPSKAPPPPPMNPGDVRREGPLPSLVLATF